MQQPRDKSWRKSAKKIAVKTEPRDPKIPSQKNERNKNIAGFTLRSEEVRLAEEERALLRAKHPEEKRLAQRGRQRIVNPLTRNNNSPVKIMPN